MKNAEKSVRKGIVLPLLCLLLSLSACADITGPEWMTGEPSPDELSYKRVVGKSQDSKDASWPRLSDVPDVKPKFSSQNERALKARDLMSDRLQADAEKTRLRNVDLYGDELEPLDEQAHSFSFSALKPEE